MFPDLAACPNETLIMQQQSNLSCSQKNPLCWEMVRVLTLWWQRFETAQCIMSPDAEKLAKSETIRLFIVCAWKTKLEKLQLVPALRFSYLYGQINEWKCSLHMYGRLVLLVSHFMASGAKASLRCLMRSRIRTEPRHPAATSRSCEPSFAVQQTPSAGHPWELAVSDGGVGGFPYFLLPAVSCWRRNESKQWVKAAVRMEWDGRWYGTCHQVSVRRAVAKTVSVPEPGTDYRWLRCCMQLFFSLCCDNTKGRAAWWIDCWAGTCELSVESAFIIFFPLLLISEEEIVTSAQWNALRPTALRTCYQYHQGENVHQTAIKCFSKVLPRHIHLSSSCSDLPPSHSMKGMDDPTPGKWTG